MDPVQDVEDRLGQEVEPAEIDRAVEQGDVVGVAVLVEQRHHLGAGEQPVRGLDRLAGRHRERGAPVVGLVPVALGLVAETRLERHVLRRYQRGQPVLVGDAEPAAGAVELDLTLLGDLLVFPLLEVAAQDADGSLMEDVVAKRGRRAPPADQAIRVERHRLVGGVGDGTADGEHVVRVELDPFGEGQALTIVPAQGDGVGRRQLATLGRP